MNLKTFKIKMNKNLLNSDNNKQDNLSNFNNYLSPSYLAKQILIKGENKKEFHSFVSKILDENVVNTKIEEEFLKKYIFSAWKLNRLRKIEKNFLDSQQSFSEDEKIWSEKNKRVRNLKRVSITQELLLLSREQEQLERTMEKSIKHLRLEQKRNNRKF